MFINNFRHYLKKLQNLFTKNNIKYVEIIEFIVYNTLQCWSGEIGRRARLRV